MKLLPIAMLIQQARQRIDVTAVAGSAGVAFTEARPTRMVQLINLSGLTAIEYRVGSGNWTLLAESDTVALSVNLATTTIRVRRFGRLDLPAQAEVFFELATSDGSVTDEEPSEVAVMVVSTDAPNDSDGRPDGTLWLQVGA